MREIRDWRFEGDPLPDWRKQKSEKPQAERRGDFKATVLYARGISVEAGLEYFIGLGQYQIAIYNVADLEEAALLPTDQILEFEVSGPGSVVETPGIVGGGFGLEGALKGMAFASVLNKLGEKRFTQTFLKVVGSSWTFSLVTDELDVVDVKARAPLMVSQLSESTSSDLPSNAGITEQLERLADLHKQGLLSDAEFSAAKTRILL